MEDTLVPIFLFLSIVGFFWLFSHYNFRKRATTHESLRYAIDKGQPISMDLIEKMTMFVDPVRADLRRGVLFIAFGVAFLFLGSIITSQEGEPFGPVLGVASFPIILGLAYLGLWRFGHGRKQ